ncbi:MAG: glycosyltransferase family 2 protein [Candidatus Sumerlaeia bacterium]|nr:glycosyltransferase family 2 protein [Candidatus Sumerlaeia bacterium]
MEPVSVVIPVYNERGALAAAAPRWRRLLEQLPDGSELVLVDDGSTDGGGAELRAIADATPGARLLAHRRNRGYGAALKTGIAAAANDLIAITDADGTYPAERIPELAAPVAAGEAAMVVAARSERHLPLLRRPAKAALKWFAEYVSGARIPDLNSGLRVFRKREVARLRRLLPDGFSFTTTLTLSLLTEDEPVLFVPIRYRARVGSSKIRPVRDTANFALLIMRIAVTFNPLRVFGPAAVLFLLAGVALLAARLVLPNPVGIATTISCFVAGVQLLAVGLLADLVNRRAP